MPGDPSKMLTHVNIRDTYGEIQLALHGSLYTRSTYPLDAI
jgi:hypothetical protein